MAQGRMKEPKVKPTLSSVPVGSKDDTTQSMWQFRSDEMTFKRYSDHKRVSARLVETKAGRKLMRVVEPESENIVCPGCQTTLSVCFPEAGNISYLSPVDFHARYKPVDRE